jgi:hypothetical protein
MRCDMWAFLFLMVGGTVGAADLHVATGGKDTNEGTQAAPFGSLARARDAIRAMKKGAGLPGGGVTVWIHKGTYPLADSLILGGEDSGTDDRPIVYRAADGEEVRLVGGRELPGKAFRSAFAQGVLDRIPVEARGHVVSADLKGLGISEYGEIPESFRGAPAVPELFFNDERMTVARWPNEDWAQVAKVVESGPAPWRDHKSDQPGTFEYEGDRPSGWGRAEGVWLHGYWCFDWCSETIKVKTIDVEKKQITFVRPHCYGLGSGNPGPRRYYAVNLLEELDRPGEYYLDRKSGELYFWPPEAIEGARVVLSTLRAPVVELTDVSHVTLRGLTVETCVGTGIRVKGGSENCIAACLVRNTGQDGIEVTDGARHRVVACDIHDTGTAGLQISGGDRKTLVSSGHEAVNNHIYRVSRRQRTHAYHIHVGGVGVKLAHNLLHDGPHQAIGLGGNDHIIEFNEIHHTGMETDDCGAFYMGRNPSERGTILRHNFWHHIGSALTHGSCAVYFDDGSGGQRVVGNVFYQAAGGNFGAVFVHGGHDNVVENNVFVECKRAIGAAPWDDRRWDDYVKAPLWQQVLLKDVDITRPPYIDRYPELKGFMEPTSRPRLNRAARNVVVRCGDFIKGNWEEKDNYVTNDDPGFVDPGAMDFGLRDGSIVFRTVKGFQGIPFDRIGLVCDELRPALPSRVSQE